MRVTQARLGGAEAGVEVGLDVLDALQPDRQPHQARGHAGGQLLLAGELAVGGAGRVDDEAAHVADVGQVAVQLQRVDELLARLHAALQVERDDRARAPRACTSAARACHGLDGSPA